MNVFQGVRPPKCNENVRYFLSAYIWIIIQQSHCNCSLTCSCYKSSSLSTTARTLISRKAVICERMLRHRAVCWGHRAAFRILRTAWCKGCCTLWRTGKREFTLIRDGTATWVSEHYVHNHCLSAFMSKYYRISVEFCRYDTLTTSPFRPICKYRTCGWIGRSLRLKNHDLTRSTA